MAEREVQPPPRQTALQLWPGHSHNIRWVLEGLSSLIFPHLTQVFRRGCQEALERWAECYFSFQVIKHQQRQADWNTLTHRLPRSRATLPGTPGFPIAQQEGRTEGREGCPTNVHPTGPSSSDSPHSTLLLQAALGSPQPGPQPACHQGHSIPEAAPHLVLLPDPCLSPRRVPKPP